MAVFGVTDIKCCAIRGSVLEWTLNNPQCAENITMILDAGKGIEPQKLVTQPQCKVGTVSPTFIVLIMKHHALQP